MDVTAQGDQSVVVLGDVGEEVHGVTVAEWLVVPAPFVGQVSPLWRDLLDTVVAMKNLGTCHGHFG